MRLLLLLLLPSLAAAAGPGDVVFTELLIDSGAGSTAEWMELKNTTAVAQSLDGCTVESVDEGNAIALDGLTVAPGAYVLLARGQTCVSFDAGDDCQTAADLNYSGIALHDGDPETLRLLCAATEIDAVTLDWGEHEADCDADVCSVNVAPAFEDAVGNDDWAAHWCVPPDPGGLFTHLGASLSASPGAPGTCVVSGPACGLGEVAFTELMVAPETAGREWMELQVSTGSGCDLHGCEIWEGPFEAVTADNLTDAEWRKVTIDAPGNSLFVADGDYALLATEADSIVGSPGEPGAILADYRYTGITLDNAEPGFLHLRCADQTVDSAPYDWPVFAPACPGDVACAVGAAPASVGAEGNDSLTGWCLAPSSDEHLSSDGQRFLGSPGAAGTCLTLPWPAPGEVVFTEFMPAPVPAVGSGESDARPEWFELHSLAAAEVVLDGCTLGKQVYEEDEDGNDVLSVPGAGGEHTLGSVGPDIPLAAGSTTVFVDSLCLDGGDPQGSRCHRDTDDGQVEDFVYSNLSFANDDPELLTLSCPDPAGGIRVIDAAPYWTSHLATQDGHSVQYDLRGNDAAATNDDLSEWCNAAFTQRIPGLTSGDGALSNYGSPGEVGDCVTGDVDVPASGPGVRCGVAAGSGGWLALVLLGLRTRRRR